MRNTGIAHVALWRRGILAAAVASSVLLAVAPSADAAAACNRKSNGETCDLQTLGGGGGGDFRLPCPTGYYLDTIDTHGGSYVDSLYGHCTSFTDSRSVKETKSTGGPGGAEYPASCLRGTFSMMSVSIAFEDNQFKFVRNIQIYCNGGPGAVCAGYGGVQCTDVSGDKNYTETCPDGMVAVGIKGRSGIYVDAIGLICGRKPVAAPAPVLTPALLPAPPPVPGTTFKRFVGVWDTSMQPNKQITLQLNQQGSLVTGDYTGAGRIVGRVVGNELTFNWTQPGASGAGHFFIADDETSFSGTFAAAADPNRFMSWGGRKVK